MNWSIMPGFPRMSEAKPEEGVTYFTVEGEESFTPCLSTGVRYKFVREIGGLFDTESGAQQQCEAHYNEHKGRL